MKATPATGPAPAGDVSAPRPERNGAAARDSSIMVAFSRHEIPALLIFQQQKKSLHYCCYEGAALHAILQGAKG